jgi:serine/threonine protein phosphatase PrpC
MLIMGRESMQVEYKTYKGSGTLNEDALIINYDYLIYGVADGVSSLVPFKSNDNLTGGYIASHEVKSYFESLNNYKSLNNGLAKINHTLRKKMSEYKIDILRKEQLWGTALAIVKITDNGVEYIQTGDCMIIAVYNNDEIRLLTRLQVSHLENIALKKWEESIQKGLKTRVELRSQVNDILISNRYKSNSKDGYGVLNGEQNALDFVEFGSINKVGLKHLIMLTDGMLLPKGVIPKGTNYWNYVVVSIINKGIDHYTKELLDLEEADPECIKYPRFKKSDDKAGVVINF